MQFVPGCTCCGGTCFIRVTLTAQCGGAAVASATVTVAASGSPGTILDTQTTNGSGIATLTVPSTGTYVVTRSKTGLTTTSSNVTVSTCPGTTNSSLTIPPATFDVNFSGCLAGCLPSATYPIRVTCTQRGSGTYTTTIDITSTALFTVTLPWYTGATPAYDYSALCPTSSGYSTINNTLNPQCFTASIGVGLNETNTGWFYFPEYLCIQAAPTTVYLTLGSNTTMWGAYAGQTLTLAFISSVSPHNLQYGICIDEGTKYSSFTLGLPFTDPNDLTPCGCVVPSPDFTISALIHANGTCASPLGGGQAISPTSMSNSYTICPFVGSSSVTATVGIHGSQTDTVTYTE